MNVVDYVFLTLHNGCNVCVVEVINDFPRFHCIQNLFFCWVLKIYKEVCDASFYFVDQCFHYTSTTNPEVSFFAGPFALRPTIEFLGSRNLRSSLSPSITFQSRNLSWKLSSRNTTAMFISLSLAFLANPWYFLLDAE